MIEQISAALPFVCQFIESKTGKTGLTVTVDVWRWNGSAWTEIVTGGSATEVGDGVYYYNLSSGSNTVEGLYLAVFKTATTSVDQQHIPSLWCVGKAGVENLDAAVSSRLATGTVASDVTAIKNKTDNLPSDPADQSELAALIAANDIRGAGADLCTLTITVNGSAVQDADVWITTDAAGAEIFAGTSQTNSSGEVPFMLDDGETYYLWMQKAGVNSIRGQSFVAEAD